MSIPESDCFGKEFDTHAFECQVCAAKAFCQTIKHQTSKQRVKKMEEQQPFFDLVNFDVINREEWASEIESCTYYKFQIIEVLMAETKADKRLCEYWFDIFCQEYSITVQEDGLCTK
jgi:hypothetical protein